MPEEQSKLPFVSFERNTEQRLIYVRDKSVFFAHVYSKTGKQWQTISISVDSDEVSDGGAANIFIHEFANNYSMGTSVQVPKTIEQSPVSEAQLVCKCTEASVFEALQT